MRIEKKNNTSERRILIGMIVDETVLGRVSAKWQKGMFRSKWANLIAGWCLKFYEKYEEAPLGQIESLFETWAESSKDKDTILLIDKFLNSLSEEWEEYQEELNSGYIIDLAGNYFNEVKIERLKENLDSDLIDGDIDKAQDRIVTYNQLELGVGEGIDVLQDHEAIKEAFADKKDPLIRYPGALGEFFSGVLERDAFISFLGPDKTGKSFWLSDIAFRAMEQRRRVAFFEVGDMSQNQVMRRLMVRAARHPLFPQIIDYPIAIEREEDEKGKKIVVVDHKTKEFTKKLSWRKAIQATKKVMKRKVRSKNSYLKLSCHPSGLVSVEMIKSIINSWALDGWIVDVIVIDYADLLNMSYPGLEGRDRINETWKRLRSLSQSYHCLVVTATQADAAAYGADGLSKANFSEDKRKNAHVTGMVGINVGQEDREIGVSKLNWIVLRDKPFNEKRFCYCAGCLGLSNPAIKSCW